MTSSFITVPHTVFYKPSPTMHITKPSPTMHVSHLLRCTSTSPRLYKMTPTSSSLQSVSNDQTGSRNRPLRPRDGLLPEHTIISPSSTDTAHHMLSTHISIPPESHISVPQRTSMKLPASIPSTAQSTHCVPDARSTSNNPKSETQYEVAHK